MSTPETVNLYLGLDAGGEGGQGGSNKTDGCRGHFGWSICYEGGGGHLERLCTGLARYAQDAITQVKDNINALYPDGNFIVLAAGIDAPLLWDKRGDRRGRRKAEDDLTQALQGINKQPPMAPYELPGEVTVQGPLAAWHLSAEWDLTITESYPRVFRQLLNHVDQVEMVGTANRLTNGLSSRASRCPSNRLCRLSQLACPRWRSPNCREECEHGHEQDATLLAMAAWAAIQDPPLPNWQNLYDGDDRLFNPSGAPVSYWTPIPEAQEG